MKRILIGLPTVSCLCALVGLPVAHADGYHRYHHYGISLAIKRIKHHVRYNRARIRSNAEAIEDNADAIENNANVIADNADSAAANLTRIEGNTSAIQTNAAGVQANANGVQANAAGINSLDSRVSNLEASGPPGGGRVFVDVDCNLDPNALFAPPIFGDFAENTTYNLSGPCNGPVYVTADRVRFVGVEPTAAIVLPGPPADPSSGAVFGDGAHDLRVQNLLIDASAWSTADIQGSGAAGVLGRNAFIRVINSRVVGGVWGMNPFRNSIIRLQGLVEISGFVNAGLSVGDQSLVSARGPVIIESNVMGGSYLTGIEVYRSGVVDVRSGVTVNMPPDDPSQGFFPASITSNQQSHVRVRASGAANLSGGVFVGTSASVDIRGGTLSGSVTASESGVVRIRDMVQTSGSNVFRLNSTATFSNSTVQRTTASLGSVFQATNGELMGAQLDSGSGAALLGTSVTGDIVAQNPSHLTFFSSGPGTGSLNGNRVFVCEEGTAIIEPSIAGTGEIVDVCP